VTAPPSAQRSAGGRRRTTAPRGAITRGTTAPHRLRRVDAWLIHRLGAGWRGLIEPLVVDLGFGAAPTTTLELADRLATVNPSTRVVGVEIDPERVRTAAVHATDRVGFVRGGFDLAAVDPPLHPRVVRAFNVLRQYDQAEVAAAWRDLTAVLPPEGLLIDGTCDELGRRAVWWEIGPDARPRTLTFAVRFGAFEHPGDLADRLPKSLIHRNVVGEPIHAFLARWDQAWSRSAPQGAFGVRQRWMATAAMLRAEGVPIVDGPARWRRGELTVAAGALMG
jgi:hypothetical protein